MLYEVGGSSAPRESNIETDCNGGSQVQGTQQVTYKGVERDALSLTKAAARSQGMKLGPWVSMHLREAAERSLAAGDNKHIFGLGHSDMQKYQEQSELQQVMLGQILDEVRLLSRTQTAIMTKLLSM
jgi:hypothetical protein